MKYVYFLIIFMLVNALYGESYSEKLNNLIAKDDSIGPELKSGRIEVLDTGINSVNLSEEIDNLVSTHGKPENLYVISTADDKVSKKAYLKYARIGFVYDIKTNSLISAKIWDKGKKIGRHIDFFGVPASDINFRSVDNQITQKGFKIDPGYEHGSVLKYTLDLQDESKKIHRVHIKISFESEYRFEITQVDVSWVRGDEKLGAH